MTVDLERATLFTPGRASYIDEHNVLQLTEASRRRAVVAAGSFALGFHDKAVFAGGFPGLAQGWDESLTPPASRREAHLMAVPLKQRLATEGLSPQDIEGRVYTQGDSSNSFGDVILSIERGMLNPDTFNGGTIHGIELVMGFLHGRRFRSMLAKGLDIDPARIRRLPMRDIYGAPSYPLQPAESAAKAAAKELAAIAVTELVLRDVEPGNLDDLKVAEQRFISIASKRA